MPSSTFHLTDKLYFAVTLGQGNETFAFDFLSTCYGKFFYVNIAHHDTCSVGVDAFFFLNFKVTKCQGGLFVLLVTGPVKVRGYFHSVPCILESNMCMFFFSTLMCMK